MLVFAYDGTLNGDWVAHYALRFALHTPERRLRLIHVDEPGTEHLVGERIARIAEEGRIVGVSLDVERIAKEGKTVAERLLDVVPTGPGTLLVTGTRARPRNMALLAGTVSARLLAVAHFPLVALRVQQPGILGQPGRVLLPLAGHPRGTRYAMPLLAHLGTDLHQLHVLYVRELSRRRFRALGAGAAEQLLTDGKEFVVRVEAELRRGLDLSGVALDSSVVVSDDVPKEILIYAGKHRSRLVCLGASERSLPRRLVYGNPIEEVLRDATCDVAVYRSLE